jgi:MYXO-CTERM domain-containing protein
VTEASKSPTGSCATCGALNDASFGRCIRCGKPLALSTGAPRRAGEQAAAWIDPSSLPATKAILTVTLLVFAGQLAAGWARSRTIAIMPASHLADDLRFGALFVDEELVAAEPWRLLSAVFVHFGVLHAAMNLYTLVSFARFAEPAVGSARFLIAYVLTGIGGFAATLGWSVAMGSTGFPTAGASGAVFGVIGLVAGWHWRRRDPRWKELVLTAVVYVALAASLVRVNNSAHVGGLVLGILLGVAFGRPEAGRRRIWTHALAAIGLLACVASLILSQLSPLWRQASRTFL